MRDHASKSVGPPVDNFVLTGSNWKGVIVGEKKNKKQNEISIAKRVV